MNAFSEKGLTLDIALTSRCPLECRYCSVARRPQEELSRRQWESVVGSFARIRKIRLISLEGGEPFVRPDLPEMVEACLDLSQEVKVVTGGTVPLNGFPRQLLRHPGFSLDISLDGPQEIHDFLRDGSWKRAWGFLWAALERGIRVRLRSVLSRYNLSVYQAWLTALDRALAPLGQKVGFIFDTVIAPDLLLNRGGTWPRAGLRSYPTRDLLPSPQEVWRLFQTIKEKSFNNLIFLQTEPLRGCGAAREGFLSFDPEGIFSFCCEASGGMGSLERIPPEECLSLLDAEDQNRPCRGCPYFDAAQCNGCWTGQKCGMVGYWGAEDCQALLDLMIRGDKTSFPTKNP